MNASIHILVPEDYSFTGIKEVFQKYRQYSKNIGKFSKSNKKFSKVIEKFSKSNGKFSDSIERVSKSIGKFPPSFLISLNHLKDHFIMIQPLFKYS